MMKNIEFRQATLADVESLAALEAKCFPPSEGATFERIYKRVEQYADRFLLMLSHGRIIGMVNGLCTDLKDLSDAMYEDASLHKDDGLWQMIFSVCIDPKFWGQGLGLVIVEKYIDEAKKHSHCRGLVLTCKEHLLHFYSENGFVDEGISSSEHGGVAWHQMRLTF